MRAKITVGEVKIELDGLDLTPRQVTALLKRAANVNLAIQVEEEPETKTPLGFSAQVELDPERNTPDVDPDWFEDSVDPPPAPSRIPFPVRLGALSVCRAGSGDQYGRQAPTGPQGPQNGRGCPQ